ncbi:MAG: hypothetical protein K2M17_06040 [Bacilli bacterium]|nr:hypothetical protein [Bacilli bacterium]
MKKVLKKSLIIAVISVLALSAVLLCACNNNRDYRNPRKGYPEYGVLYSLLTAFENGWISENDLQNIAYYHTGEVQRKGFNPTPKYLETLSEENELAIRQAFFEENRSNDKQTVDQVQIKAYLGCYDGLVAVKISQTLYNNILDRVDRLIGGVVFSTNGDDELVLWRM